MARRLAERPAIPSAANRRSDFCCDFFSACSIAPRAPERDRQRDFNLALLDLVNDLRSDIGRIRDDLKRDIETVQRDVRVADEALAEELRKDPRADSDRRETQRLADRCARSEDRNGGGSRARCDESGDRVVGRQPPIFSTGGWRMVLRGVVDVADYVAPRRSAPVIDVGCGRGEFLIACRDAGIAARGFDTNERSVADLVARGIDASRRRRAGMFRESSATRRSERSWRCTSSSICRSMRSSRCSRESSRVLRAGGLLIIETPNAESLAVSASEFWRDPTHLAPRHPAALTLLAREHGFAIDEIRAIHPFPECESLRRLERGSSRARRRAQRARLRRAGSAVGPASQLKAFHKHKDTKALCSVSLWLNVHPTSITLSLGGGGGTRWGIRSEDQAGDQAAEVGGVVDEGEAVADGDVHGDPEDQLADQAARPRLVAVQRRAADREDERAHDAEDRAARADGRAFGGGSRSPATATMPVAKKISVKRFEPNSTSYNVPSW